MSEMLQPQPGDAEAQQEAEVIQMPIDEIRREELRLAATERAHQENLARPAADRDPLMQTVREELIADRQAKIDQMKVDREDQQPEETREAA